MTDLRDQIEQAWSSAEEQSAEPKEVVTSENNETAPEPVEVITAPNSYRQEFKDSFNTLSPDWQKYLNEREKEYQQGLSKARNAYNWIDKFYNDRKDSLTSQGYKDVQDYLETLDGIATALSNDPATTLARLSSIYNVSNTDDTLQKQLNAYGQQISQLQGYLQSRENERAKTEYDNFINAKDEAGNPVHGYFEDVRAEMQTLLKAGLAKGLEDAYNQAIWRVESVREKLLDAKAKETLSAKTTQAKVAKAAAFDPSSKNDGKAKAMSLREEIERNYDNLGD